jgi:TonB-linked SusC/RagA family outer membrane protein
MRTKFKWIFTLLVAFSMQFSFAQEKTVTGVVTDNLGPLPGVNVVVKGTTNGTQTDFDGKYSIKVKVGDVLEFAFLSMKTQTIKVGASNSLNVTMVSSAEELSEVVVVAYGVQKKEAITGSISEIKSDVITKITTGDVIQGLVGKTAGVQVFNGSGMPGDSPTIRIRGIGSLSANASPLFVVDGVPFNGDTNSINAQDVESMSILKDASAAALYGSRGANGVVIITTKKGSKFKKSSVTVDSRSGFAQRAVKDYNFIKDEKAYYEAYYQGLKNSYMYTGNFLDNASASALASSELITGSQGLQYNSFNVANDQLIDPATGRFASNSATLKYKEDWSDYLFGDGFFTQTSISVSGGNDNTTHYFSAGYEKNDGYVVNSGFEKITTRFKIDSKVNDRFTLGGNIGYTNIKQNYLDGYTGGSAYSSPFFWVRAVAPIYPVRAYDFNGSPIINASGVHIFDDGTGANGLSPVRPYGPLQHPYATAVNDIKKYTTDNLYASGYFDFKILDGLVFTYNVTGELFNANDASLDTPLYGDAVDAGGRVSYTNQRTFALTQQQLLKYNKKFGNHDIDFLVGHETLQRNMDGVSAERSKLLLPGSPYVNHASLNQGNSGYGSSYALEAFLSRFAYGYDNKYFINASFRRDGSSRFHPDNRWGNFYGLGAAWRVSQESFMKNVTWVDEFKLKASLGQQGNDNLGYELPYLTQYFINYTTDSTLPISYSAGSYLGNKNITWETTTNYNAGFDVSLFNRRLNIEAEYFVRDITDMLFFRPLPPSTGFQGTPENIGDMQNVGIEVTIGADVVRTKDFSVTLNLNATSYKNEITRLPENNQSNNRIISGNFIREEGGGAYDYYMKEFAGVNPVNGAALFWMNVDDDDPSLGRILTENNSEADLYRLGKTALPDVFGGFGANIAYKGFDLGINFAYQVGGYSTDGVWLGGFGVDPGQGIIGDISNTWTPNNTTASLPRFDVQDPLNYYSSSSLLLIKSDYLSIQDLTVGYTFDNSLAEKLGLSKLRVYGLADNVALWSKRQGFDPRQSGVTGASSNNYSLLRTISFGINLQF